MKKILFTVIALSLSASIDAQDTIKVTGDRVSLRAAPDTNAVLLGRAMLGDTLVLKDNSHPDWVGVQPLTNMDFWIHREFVSNNVVLPDILNIRSGPSVSHSVVGSAQKDDVLTVRGEIADWIKIAPTSNTVVWISRTYVELPAPVGIEPIVASGAKSETQAVEQVVLPPIVQEIVTAIPVTAEKNLVTDPSKPQGVEGTYSGVLQPADGKLYKLVDDHFTDVSVCYITGNSAQMQTFTGMKLEITGKIYWVEGRDMPILRPVRIKPFSTEP